MLAGYVTAMTGLDEVLFVAGNFQYVGSNFVGSIASYYDGQWTGLSESGISNGMQRVAIHSISLIDLECINSWSTDDSALNLCLILGGEFTSIGSRSVKNMAYLCYQDWNMLKHNTSSEFFAWNSFEFDVNISTIFTVAQDL